MGITPSTIILIMNILVGVIVVICALVGFARGTKKSIFYMIVTAAVVILTWIFMTPLCNLLMGINVSTFVSDPVDVNGTQVVVTNLKDTVAQIVSVSLFGGDSATDTATLELVLGIVSIIFKIVVYLISIFLAFTVYKIIADIIWGIIKPKKEIDENGKKKTPKPSGSSRLIGLGIGAVKGLLYTVLFFFLFAGLVSIIEDTDNLFNSISDANQTYGVVIVDDTATLITLSEESQSTEDKGFENPLDEYRDILNLVTAYSDSIPGKVLGSIKFGDTSIDEALFDGLFSFKGKVGEYTDENGKTKTLKYNVKLRKEIASAVKAYSEVSDLFAGGFNIEKLNGYDPEKLRNAVDELSKLELIKVIVPVGLEIVFLGDVVNIENEDIQKVIDEISLDELKAIDYGAEFKNIGYALVDVVDILSDNILSKDEEGNIKFNFTAISPKKLDAMFSDIGGLNLVSYIAPFAVSYVLTLDSIKESLDNVGISLEDLGITKVEDWQTELTNLGKIFSSFLDLGLKMDDKSKMDFSGIEMTKVDNLADAIFNSVIISNAIPAIADMGITALGEYGDVINLPKDINWKNELSPLLKAAFALLKSNLFDNLGSEDADITKAFESLDDKTIDDIALYLSQSSIIKNALNGLIEKFMTSSEDLKSLNLKGFDNVDDWTKDEIGSIFHAIKDLFGLGILGGEDIISSLGSIEDAKITSLANNLANSKFIVKNLGSLLDYALSQMDSSVELTIQTLEENEWTKDEISNIFLTLKDFASSGIIGGSDVTESFKSISNKVIESLGTHISSSKFLTKNLTELLNMVLKDVDLDGVKISGFEDSSEWTKEEIVALLKSAKLIMTYSDDLTKLINLSDDELDPIVDSKLITKALVSYLKNTSKEGSSLDIIKGLDLVSDDGWKDNTLQMNSKDYSYNNGTVTITKIPTEINANQYDVYNLVDGTYVKVKTGTTANIYVGDLGTNPSIMVVAREKGEIRKLFKAISIIVGDISEGIDSSKIVDNLTTLTNTQVDTVLESIVINETILCKIEEYATGTDKVLSIPVELKSSTGTIDRNKWQTTKEANNILNALKLVFNGADIDTSNLKLGSIIDNKDEILKSLIISETIKSKITEVDGIDVPEELSASSLDGWKNTYNNNVISSYGELSHLLGSLNIALNITSETTINSFDVDSIKFSTIINKSDEILKSLIITNTIRTKITDNSTIIVPDVLDHKSLDDWKNIYKNEEVVTRGEVSYILNAISKIANIDDNTTINNFNVDIKLGNLISERTKILHSLVISETIKKQIIDAATKSDAILSLPANYQVSTSKNYITWNNTYNNDTVATKGELDNILGAIGSLLPNTDISFDNISNLNYSAIFDSESQKTIISSKLISETIINKVEEMSALSIPNTSKVKLHDKNDRSDWWNISSGELVCFLNAINTILTPSQKASLDSSIELSVDTVYNKMINENNRTTLLKSYIVADTITVNFMNLSDVFTIPSVSNAGVDLSASGNRDNWYYINDNRTTITHKELWNMITSINLLLGDSYTASTNFTIDQLLGNVKFIPTLNANKENTNKTVSTFLESKLIEEVFVKLVKDIVIEGAMKDYMNAPTGGYLWYYYLYQTSSNGNKEYDLQTILESIYMMNSAGLSYNMNMTVSTLDTLDVEKLSDAFVISRTFRGSIEKCLGGLLSPLYQAAYALSVYNGSPIPAWNTVKLNQADFDALDTKLEAQTLLASKLNTIINNIKSVN